MSVLTPTEWLATKGTKLTVTPDPVTEDSDIGLVNDSDDSHQSIDPNSDQFVFVERSADGKIVAKGSQVQDYIFRGAAFKEMCVWDFVSQTEKSSMQYLKCKDSASCFEEEDNNEEDGFQPVDGGGRTPLARDKFMDEHPESKTHLSLLRSIGKEYVPVPLGRSIYRCDRDDVKEEYCRLMLLLFKPWRDSMDLKGNHDTWEEAFNVFKVFCDSRLARIMENMQQLHECKDSRDDHYQNRRLRRRTSGK